jgi:hypothetical protein
MIAVRERPTRTKELQLPAPPEPVLLEAAPSTTLIGPPRGTPSEEETQDGEYPPHMLLWSVVGVIAYFAVIAAAMIYAGIILPNSIR